MERPLTSKAVSKANLPCKCRQWGFAYSDRIRNIHHRRHATGTATKRDSSSPGQNPRKPVPGGLLWGPLPPARSPLHRVPRSHHVLRHPVLSIIPAPQWKPARKPARPHRTLTDMVDAVWWWFRGGGAPDLEPDEAAKACAPIQSKPGLGRRFDRDAETPALWPVHRAQGPSRGPAPPSRRVCPPAAWVRLSISSNAKASESRRMLCPGQAGEREAAGPLAAACRRGTEDAKRGWGWARPRLRISK